MVLTTTISRSLSAHQTWTSPLRKAQAWGTSAQSSSLHFSRVVASHRNARSPDQRYSQGLHVCGQRNAAAANNVDGSSFKHVRLTTSQLVGVTLIMGVRTCSRCHSPSGFQGAHPAMFCSQVTVERRGSVITPFHFWRVLTRASFVPFVSSCRFFLSLVSFVFWYWGDLSSLLVAASS